MKIRKAIKWCLKGYIAIAAILGTIIIARTVIIIGWNAYFAPAPMPIYLPNGFKYTHDWKNHSSGQVITSVKNDVIIAADVRKIMWYENSVYGYRIGQAGEVYYFFCTYGEECAVSQNLSDIQLNQLTKENGAPQFDRRQAKSYDDLLWEQSKTDTGKVGG